MNKNVLKTTVLNDQTHYYNNIRYKEKNQFENIINFGF